MDIDAINERIAAVHRGRKWILTPDVAAAATPLAATLAEHDAEGVMVVAGSEGVGDLPDVDRIYYTRTAGDGIMDSFRALFASIEDPSGSLLDAVDAFDPTHDALVLGASFSRRDHLAGRPVYGVRLPQWRAFEDKMIVDKLWDDAGVERAPSAIVAVNDAEQAAQDLATEQGSVWVADNTEGWHGGGDYTRWLRPGVDNSETVAWFRTHAAQVRVMPFLDGLPCSIHGFITRDGIAVFRPVELFILRERDRPRFYYAQGANFWSPPVQVITEMRDAARRVGEQLQEQVGYLGAFGIDGVLTVDGFRPHELNPRLTLGHGLQCRPLGIPLGSMERLMFEGDLDIDAVDLESTVMEGTQETRSGGMIFTLMSTYPKASLTYRFANGGAVETQDDAEADGVMTIGQAAFGSVVIVRPDPDRTPVGPSLAPQTVQLLDLAREAWDLDAPYVDHPPDVWSDASVASP
ncbi:MAG: hypothetical protein ACR2NG_04030 [Acidimicrobiia bacterium]